MRWAALGTAGLLVLPVLVIAAVVSGGTGDAEAGGNWGGRPEALADIPAGFLALYREAADRFAIPIEVLAAVGKVECDHGRNPACAIPNAAGAVGPMQFLPGTFAAYASAAASASPSIFDPRDAVFAAAAKLAADGVAAAPGEALFAYNHDESYVATVVAWAVAYGWMPADPALLVRAALFHPNVDLRPSAAGDVEAGLVDQRLLALVLMIATTHRLGSVGPFVTGHSLLVAGTDRASDHAVGRAVDLPSIDGTPVSATNRGARAVAIELLGLPVGLRPSEVGLPWADLATVASAFSDQAHQDHLHVSAPLAKETK
jgi:hypothetical protein